MIDNRLHLEVITPRGVQDNLDSKDEGQAGQRSGSR